MNQKVPMSQKIGILLGGGGITGVYYMVTMLAMFFYTNVMGLSPAAVGTMILIAKIWDAVNDPMCGSLIDRTHTRYGKAKPWLFAGGILIFIFGILLFTVPNTGGTGKLIWAYITYNGVGMAFTACMIGTVVLMPRITSDPSERVSLSAYCTVGQTVVAIAAAAVIMPLIETFSLSNPNSAYRNTALIIGGIGLVLTMLFVFIIREQPDDEGEISKKEKRSILRALKEVLTNKPFVIMALICIIQGMALGMHNGSLLYYLTFVLQDTTVSSALMVVIYAGTFIASLAGKTLAKFDKVLVSKISFLVMAAGILLRYATGDANIAVMLAGELLVGLGAGMFTVYAITMFMDCAEYGFNKDRARNDGLILSSLTFQNKIGQGLGSAVMGFWLEFSGYDETAAVQAESALKAVSQVHFLPLLLVAIVSFVLLMFYKLNNKEVLRIMEENREILAAQSGKR